VTARLEVCDVPADFTRKELPVLIASPQKWNSATQTMSKSLDIPNSVRDFEDLEENVEVPLARYPPPLDPPENNVDDDIEQNSSIAPLEREKKTTRAR
jgi:hypothetical protein